MLPIKEFYNINSDQKDEQYAHRMITFLRTYSSPLVNLEKAREGMMYLMAEQDMSSTEDLFQNPAASNLDNKPVRNRSVPLAGTNLGAPTTDKFQKLQPEMRDVDFKSLNITEKLRNMITAEIKKMGVVLSVRATDPTSTFKRKKDEYFIKHSSEFENLFTYLYSAIGQKKPVSLDEYALRFGEKHDSGNTSSFKEMGFDKDDPQDVATFMNYFYKLDAEIAAQEPIEAITKFNQVEDDKFEKWATDAMAKKAVAAQIYVSEENGAIIYNYVTPETVSIYGGGRRKDYNDAMAKCVQQAVTVKEFLDRVGSAFSFEDNLNDLILAIYSQSLGTIDITGINPDIRGYNSWYCQGRGDGTNVKYTYNQFLQFKVNVGYIEWSSQNETEYGKSINGTGKKFDNKKEAQKGGITYINHVSPDGKKYPTKARYECPTYKAYFLSLTTITQIMFEFGKVTYQDIEGYNDFNSNFSIITYKEIGEPISLQCAPFIQIINEAWYKFKWEIRRAKPSGTDFNYDSIITMAENIFTDDTSAENKVKKMVEWMSTSADTMWTYPRDANGNIIHTQSNQMNVPRPNGLSKNVMEYWQIIISTWDRMLFTIGLDADLRQGNAGNSRDSMNNQFKALEYSQNNTFYVPDMITFMCQNLATRTLMIVQDIIQFKDYDTLAYKFLVDLVGEETLSKIADLGKKASHRYAIFVESLNQAPARMKLQQRLDFALQNGKVTNSQALLVENIKSPQKAFLILAYFEQRETTIAQKNAMQSQKAQQDAAMQLKQMELKIELTKGDYMIAGKKIDAEAQVKGHAINQDGKIANTVIKGKQDTEDIYHQTDNNLREIMAQNSQASTQPTPNIPQPPAPQGIPPQGAPPAMQQPNNATQLRNNAEPAPTGAAMQ